MIFQRWVMSCCGGKPSEAIRRIEAAAGGAPCDTSRVYRAMRVPLAFTGKLARDVVLASENLCTLAELIDVDLIREHFEYTNPDLRRRGLEYAIAKATKRAEVAHTRVKRAEAVHQAQLAEVHRLTHELGVITAGGMAPKPKRTRVAARPAKRPVKRKRRAGARAA
jgi:hypothetical protein